MDVHAEIRSKRTETVTPCIHFLLLFRGICQSDIRTAMRKCCCSHIIHKHLILVSNPGFFTWSPCLLFRLPATPLPHFVFLKFTGKIHVVSVRVFFTWWYLRKAMCASCPATVLSGYFRLVLTGPTGHPFDADPPQWEHCGMVVYV